jgi:hypothetical protein
MKIIARLATVLCLGSMLCLAETWTGKLVDANCKDQSKEGAAPSSPSTPSKTEMSSTCAPTRSTTAYGVEMSDGRVLKLDSTGNAKASEAMKANARSASGSKSGAVVVTVTGSLDGHTVKVDTIDIQ